LLHLSWPFTLLYFTLTRDIGWNQFSPRKPNDFYNTPLPSSLSGGIWDCLASCTDLGIIEEFHNTGEFNHTGEDIYITATLKGAESKSKSFNMERETG